jgi:surface polysaccharide O-acyltransferase-like enzyme
MSSATFEGKSIQNDKPDSASAIPLPVDLIRAVAIIMVITYHVTTQPYNTADPVLWLSVSAFQSLVLMGVPIFIMLSGALLLQPSKVNEPIRVFMKKRLARIGIAFVFWSAIYFAWDHYVNHAALTAQYIMQKMLYQGAYSQFWFIYLIIGLYLITPILRPLVAYAKRNILRYFIVLWLAGAVAVPLFGLITGFGVDPNLFFLSGCLGYFVLGWYLIGVDVKTKILKLLLAVGIVCTIVGLVLMTFVFPIPGQTYFFTFNLSANIVLASVAVYLLLAKYPPNWPGPKRPVLDRLVKLISANTLAIFFMHIIVLEILHSEFQLFLNQMPAIFEIPLVAAATLFICLGVILAVKKVPVFGKLIG